MEGIPSLASAHEYNLMTFFRLEIQCMHACCCGLALQTSASSSSSLYRHPHPMWALPSTAEPFASTQAQHQCCSRSYVFQGDQINVRVPLPRGPPEDCRCAEWEVIFHPSTVRWH